MLSRRFVTGLFSWYGGTKLACPERFQQHARSFGSGAGEALRWAALERMLDEAISGFVEDELPCRQGSNRFDVRRHPQWTAMISCFVRFLRGDLMKTHSGASLAELSGGFYVHVLQKLSLIVMWFGLAGRNTIINQLRRAAPYALDYQR
jgi:hypothetical protein